MASLRSISFLLLLLLLISCSSTTLGKRTRVRNNKPCKSLVVYFHDILYNGKNAKNSTSAIVGVPSWANKTILTQDQFHFGTLVAFDDPITLDSNLNSTPIGRAQGFYLYNGKSTYAAWFSVSFVFNSTKHRGSLNLAGTEYAVQRTRDIAVTGGTGDFFMARGVASLETDAIEGSVYFRLRFDIKLYECW